MYQLRQQMLCRNIFADTVELPLFNYGLGLSDRHEVKKRTHNPYLQIPVQTENVYFLSVRVFADTVVDLYNLYNVHQRRRFLLCLGLFVRYMVMRTSA